MGRDVDFPGQLGRQRDVVQGQGETEAGRVEVVVPDEYMGPVNGDLISRRGRLEGTEILGSTQIIKAMVPLSTMFGYATELRSRTQGRGAFTMHFGQYEEVPKSTADEIMKRNNPAA